MQLTFTKTAFWLLSFAAPMFTELPVMAQNIQQPTQPSARRSYIGVGGGLGVSGSETGLSDGGPAILTRIGLSEQLSFHNATVFGDNTALMLAFTVGKPIRNTTSSQVMAYPFIGGGVNINTSNDFQIDPLLTTGIDIPLSNRLSATGRVNVGFQEDETDIGLLLGVGYSL
jgi:hypothetical protein